MAALYQRVSDGNSAVIKSDGTLVTIGTPAWTDYMTWLSKGNTPDPAGTPPVFVLPPLTVPQMMGRVDDAVAQVYSNWTRFQQEYLLRQDAAQAFKDANYSGDPGIWVTAFATAAGLSYQAATDTILSQGSNLNTALETLGALRMQKYNIQKAADLPSATTVYNNLITQIKAVASQIS